MNAGHISALTDGVPRMDTCSQLHQLQIWKLLQHEGKIVCPEGLNGELESLQLTFPELPIWDTATPSEHFLELQLLEVDLHSAQPEGMTTTTQLSTTTLVQTYSLTDTFEPPYDITMTINLHLQGALEWLQQASSAASTPVSQHSMPRRGPPSVALGAPSSTEGRENPLGQKETDSTIPASAAMLTQTPLWVVTPGDTPSLAHTIHQLLQLTLPQTPEMVSIPSISQPQATPRVKLAEVTDELLQLQERMNVAL